MDRHECGDCQQQFSQVEEFLEHKQNACRGFSINWHWNEAQNESEKKVGKSKEEWEWKCRICLECSKNQEDHLSHCHGITPTLYEHLVKDETDFSANESSENENKSVIPWVKQEPMLDVADDSKEDHFSRDMNKTSVEIGLSTSRIRKSTGTYCSSVDCHNCQIVDGKRRGIKFYRFPADPQRRKLWELRVKRMDWQPTPSSRLCSEHFVSGSKSDDPKDVDYLPSLFKAGHIKQPMLYVTDDSQDTFSKDMNKTSAEIGLSASRIRKSTGTYCSAVDCHNCQSIDGKGRGIKFHRFPADPRRRKLWELRVKRIDWHPTPASRLCSEHFVSGSKSDDPNDIDYLPSVFKTGKIQDVAVDFKEVTLLNNIYKKTVVEKESSEERPWWDGCSYECNYCGAQFPEIDDIRMHIYQEHSTNHQKMEMTETTAKKKWQNSKLGQDFRASKITKWLCKLCAATILRKHSSISYHLMVLHNGLSLKGYEEKISELAAEKIAARNTRKSAKDFYELATGNFRCKICLSKNSNSKSHGKTDPERHLLEHHGIKSLEEYEDVAKNLPKNSWKEESQPRKILKPPGPVPSNVIKLKCYKCPYSSNSIENVRDHTKRVHDGLKCDKCNYSTKIHVSLMVHDRVSHPGIPLKSGQANGINCENCKKVVSNMSLHKMNVHGIPIDRHVVDENKAVSTMTSAELFKDTESICKGLPINAALKKHGTSPNTQEKLGRKGGKSKKVVKKKKLSKSQRQLLKLSQYCKVPKKIASHKDKIIGQFKDHMIYGMDMDLVDFNRMLLKAGSGETSPLESVVKVFLKRYSQGKLSMMKVKWFSLKMWILERSEGAVELYNIDTNSVNIKVTTKRNLDHILHKTNQSQENMPIKVEENWGDSPVFCDVPSDPGVSTSQPPAQLSPDPLGVIETPLDEGNTQQEFIMPRVTSWIIEKIEDTDYMH